MLFPVILLAHSLLHELAPLVWSQPGAKTPTTRASVCVTSVAWVKKKAAPPINPAALCSPLVPSF